MLYKRKSLTKSLLKKYNKINEIPVRKTVSNYAKGKLILAIDSLNRTYCTIAKLERATES